ALKKPCTRRATWPRSTVTNQHKSTKWWRTCRQSLPQATNWKTGSRPNGKRPTGWSRTSTATSLQSINLDICQLVWLTKNTSYENVGGIFLLMSLDLVEHGSVASVRNKKPPALRVGG